METLETNFQSNNSVDINDEIKGYLLESAKWTKFLSIFGFIFLGFLELFSILILIVKLPYPYNNPYMNRSPAEIIIGFVMVGLNFFPVYYLYQFSKSMKQGINPNNQKLFAFGTKNLKLHHKFIGFLVLVGTAFYILSFILALLTS